MQQMTNLTVGMECTDGTILTTGAAGGLDNSEVDNNEVTVTSTDWEMQPNPNDGREYYVFQVEYGRSWKCYCTAFEGDSATFSVIQTNPC